MSPNTLNRIANLGNETYQAYFENKQTQELNHKKAFRLIMMK